MNMKGSIPLGLLAISLVFLVAGSTLANPQTSAAGARRSNAQVIESILLSLQERIVDIADAMPAEKYSFAPTCGEFKGVRSFGEQLKHIAADLYLDGAAILGEDAPGIWDPVRPTLVPCALSQRSSHTSKRHSSTCVEPRPGLMMRMHRLRSPTSCHTGGIPPHGYTSLSQTSATPMTTTASW